MTAATNRSEMSDDTASRIHTFIADDLLMGQGVEFGNDDSLLEEGIIDSLGLLEIVNFIEAEFELSVEDEDVTLDNFGTVSAIASYVEASKTGT